jgi:uncharacterized membrane protein YvlD (DUF360 family)
MRTVGLGAAILVSVVLLLAVWLVGRVAGYEVSLGSSIVATIVLTVVINLVLGAFSRRNRRF